jgi:hypothetical protein
VSSSRWISSKTWADEAWSLILNESGLSPLRPPPLSPLHSDTDGFDEFVGEVLQESVKTSSGMVWGTIELQGTAEKRKRIRIPHPRTTRQLARAITPQIRSAPEGTYGYELASEAWTVSSLWMALF